MCMDEQYCEASSKPALTMPTVVPESVQLLRTYRLWALHLYTS